MMNGLLPDPPTRKLLTDTQSVMHVMVIYDDAIARRQACMLQERLGRQFAEDCEFEFVWSRIDQLQDNLFVSEAVGVAEEADLVVVALTNAAWVPRGFRNWMAGWRRCATNKHAALALLAGQLPGKSNGASPLIRALSRLADSSGLTFIHGSFALPGKIKDTSPPPRRHGSEIVRRIREDLTTAEAPVRWGINE